MACVSPQRSRCWFTLAGHGGSELRASCWPCLSLSPPAALGGHRGPCPGSWLGSPPLLLRVLGIWGNKAAAAVAHTWCPISRLGRPPSPRSLGGHRAPTCWQGGAQAGARRDPSLRCQRWWPRGARAPRPGVLASWRPGSAWRSVGLRSGGGCALWPTALQAAAASLRGQRATGQRVLA